MFDLSIGKLLVIGVLALFLVGPEKLPQYATRLAGWVRVARRLADDAKRRVATEMGPGFDDVDWAALDPRRYHPKRLLADAWNTEPSAAARPGRAPAVDADEPDLLALAEADARAAEPPRAAGARYDAGS